MTDPAYIIGWRAALRVAAEVARRHKSKIGLNEPLWHEGQDWAADRIEQAILALPVPSLRETLASMVKPLEWEANFADHPFGFYETIDCGNSVLLTRSGVEASFFDTIEAAEAAGQADYTRRILAALGVTE